jgi:hypothetical protein
MRGTLDWDVLWVIEEDQLRRASDLAHYKLARQLRRTLVTMDRDYLDDRRFPPGEGSGVIVIQAPNERELTALVERLDRVLFQPPAVDASPSPSLPLDGRKLHAQTDWGRNLEV